MAQKSCFLLIYSFISTMAFAQADSSKTSAAIFDRIARSVQEFRLDTTAAPDDKITRKITELMNLRGGFNIHEAIAFKLAEDRQKNEISKEELDKLSLFFLSGSGKRWLDHAINRIYRNHFSYKELKQLVKFYKTSAGQKLATEFPIIMIQSLKAAEMIKEFFTHQSKKG